MQAEYIWDRTLYVEMLLVWPALRCVGARLLNSAHAACVHMRSRANVTLDLKPEYTFALAS